MSNKTDIEIAESQANETKVSTAETELQNVLIPVKFNKKIQQLNLEEASKLAQKGMKFDAISEDYETLKALANKSGKSVSMFLEALKQEKAEARRNELLDKCGGDSGLAEHILKLEEDSAADVQKFGELKEKFPEIKSAEQLPDEVLENAKLSGRALLDEYLRYLLDEKIRLKAAAKQQEKAESLSLGSQASRNGIINPETAEFLRGLWK